MGLGKLGLPVALACESKGHQIAGWDPSEVVRANIDRREIRYDEQGAQELLDTSELQILEPGKLVEWADLVFVCVQTPHQAKFEGVTRIPNDRADFDYTWLQDAVRTVDAAAQPLSRPTTMVVVSTVLPGTMETRIAPLLSEKVDLVYNPAFIAMGTTVHDYLNPEFVLVGSDWAEALETVRGFYGTLNDAPIITTGIREAELTKVAYNVFLGMKLDFVNTMAMFCDATGTDVDQVTTALSFADRRLWSHETYWSAGMGDGGGCHPRDCIALSWLARQTGQPYDLFEDVMRHRERHTEWIAQRTASTATALRLPMVVVGQSYKANSSLTVGSSAVLLANLIRDMGRKVTTWDPWVRDEPMPSQPAVYCIAARHDRFVGMEFPRGSVVIDPWGIIHDHDGVTVYRLGRSDKRRR
jgi:UDPglucose 6-dehydrogenase